MIHHMVDNIPWYENEPEGKNIRTLIGRLTKEAEEKEGETTEYTKLMELARAIAYLASVKNNLAQSSEKIEDRIGTLERMVGLRKDTILTA